MKRIRSIAFLAMIAIAVTFSSGGCIGTLSDEADIEDETEEKKKVEFPYVKTASEFLHLYQEANEDANDYIIKDSENDHVLYEGLGSLIAKQMKYKITSKDVKNTPKKVYVTIENIDFTSILSEVLDKKENGETAEMILSHLETSICDKNAPKKSYDCEIDFIADGDTYRIELNDQLMEALYGGYNE